MPIAEPRAFSRHLPGGRATPTGSVPLAHYARNVPPVPPPERSLLPDQPRTAWWEIEAAERYAPPPAPRAATSSGPVVYDAAHFDSVTHPGRSAEAPATATAPEGATQSGDAPARGGMRRVGAEPAATPSAPPATPASADSADTVDADSVSNWALLEMAATSTNPSHGVHTIYGRFEVEGVARRAGDLIFTGVTFPDAMTTVPAPGAIQLTIDSATNVAEAGLVVADIVGFAADRQGFTLITTARGTGLVRAYGHYVVEI